LEIGGLEMDIGEKEVVEMGKARRSNLWGGITIVLIACYLGAAAQGKYGGGTGTPEDPYQIWDANHMQAIGADANDWDKHFRLMADIDLAKYTGTQFNTIGRWTDEDDPRNKAFTGCFDGYNHKIYNFSWSSPSDEKSIGLFAWVGSHGQIKELGQENTDVRVISGRYVGGLVGRNEGAIANCYSRGSVSGNDCVGGLVGWNEFGTITNCYSTGSVSGDSGVGGLVGFHCRSQISDCYSRCNVTGTRGTGGLVGENGWNSYGAIIECYSTGCVLGGEVAGGIAGYSNGTITYCYSTGRVSGETRVGGLVGDNRRGVITNCHSEGNITGNDNVGGLVGFGGVVVNSFWDVDTSGQLTSAGGAGKTTTEMQMASTYLAWNGCGEIIWTLDKGKDYPRLAWEGYPAEPLPSQQLSDFLEGSGRETDPYLISTAEELNLIGLFVCEWDKQYRLVADINLANYISTSFNIIGTHETNFTGVFDGKEHRIWNFAWASDNIDYIGIFGYVGSEGQIRNLGMENTLIEIGAGDMVGGLAGLNQGQIMNCYSTGSVSVEESDWGYIGGLVGNNGGTIRSCYSTSTVSGDYIVGGLVGANEFGEPNISHCYTRGTVTGSAYVGGLVGSAFFGTVTACCSESTVSGDRNVGCLAGYNWYGMITACYSTGSASGETDIGGLIGYNERGWTFDCYSSASVLGVKFVGGLAGNNDSMIANSYSTGHVLGSRYIGGLVGCNDGNVRDSFWDIETSGRTTSDGGTGETTANMHKRITFTDAGWDFLGERLNGIEDIWFIPQEDYPHLWWEGMEVSMKLTPRTLNCRSKGNWVRARLTLPEGFTVADVDTDRPAVLHSFGFESGPLHVFVNENELVEIEAAFDREAVCSLAGDWPEALTVAGFLADGNIFLGTSTVRMIAPGMKEIEELALYWLNADCDQPDWCDGIDLSRDSVVNLLDYALLLNSQVEFIRE
jgi:hypothetical protein